MGESRETRRSILSAGIEQFLDHLEELEADEFQDGLEMGAVVIAVEANVSYDGDPSVVPTYWCSNENAIWQRGFFEILTDYKQIPRE